MNAPCRFPLSVVSRDVRSPAAIGQIATACLQAEIALWPKPGLVSPVDSGSHTDMDCALMHRSAATLEPFFAALALAGAHDADMDCLRTIGLAAEAAMLAATGNVNTHRGAIFGMGLLCAATGWRNAKPNQTGISSASPNQLGGLVRERWGAALRTHRLSPTSHGARASHEHGVGGARAEAAGGFATLYGIGLPALRGARAIGKGERPARVQALFALIAAIDDTNLLHRGGAEGLQFAQSEAAAFCAKGGVAAADWQESALRCHRAFVRRRLSPGGAADLLAMALFVDAMGCSL